MPRLEDRSDMFDREDEGLGFGVGIPMLMPTFNVDDVKVGEGAGLPVRLPAGLGTGERFIGNGIADTPPTCPFPSADCVFFEGVVGGEVLLIVIPERGDDDRYEGEEGEAAAWLEVYGRGDAVRGGVSGGVGAWRFSSVGSGSAWVGVGVGVVVVGVVVFSAPVADRDAGEVAAGGVVGEETEGTLLVGAT